jgi:glycosyltransferase involved in cell wall biosynthesis
LTRQILHVITTLEKGGAENAVALLAKLQATQNKVVIFPLKGVPELFDELTREGVEVNTSLLNRNFLTQILLLGVKISKAPRDKILHAHLPRAEILLAICSLWQKRIATRHNSEPFWPKAPLPLSRIVARLSTRNAALICISKSVSDFLENSHEISQLTRKTIIHYGYLKQVSRRRNEPKFSPFDKIIIGTIARLEAQKNLPFLIQTAVALKKYKINFEIRILGSGSQYSFLRREVRNLKLDEFISFYDRQLDVFPFLFDLDVFILPSLYEGFGYVLLEAMDAQVPVFVSKLQVFKEILGEDHELYFSTSSTDEIVSLFQKLLLQNIDIPKIIDKQLIRLEIFSSRRYLDAHEVFYDEIVRYTPL